MRSAASIPCPRTNFNAPSILLHPASCSSSKSCSSCRFFFTPVSANGQDIPRVVAVRRFSPTSAHPHSDSGSVLATERKCLQPSLLNVRSIVFETPHRTARKGARKGHPKAISTRPEELTSSTPASVSKSVTLPGECRRRPADGPMGTVLFVDQRACYVAEPQRTESQK